MFKMSLKASTDLMTENPTENLHILKDNYPKFIDHIIACNLKGEALSQCVAVHFGLWRMKCRMSEDFFQKFLLNFLKELEDETLELVTHLVLQDQFDAFKKKVLDASQDGGFDPTVGWLGLFPHILPQWVRSEEGPYDFFQPKFRVHQRYYNLPVPRIHSQVEILIPERGDTKLFEDRAYPMAQRMEDERSTLKRKWKVSEMFFVLMAALVTSFKYERHHEVLAYAFEILTKPVFQNRKFSESFIFAIWGYIGVTCAKLGMRKSLVQNCMNKSQSLTRSFAATVLDMKLFEQEKFASFGAYKEEALVFKKLFALVPTTSLFFQETVRIHLSCVVKEIEDCMVSVMIELESEVNRDLFSYLEPIEKGKLLIKSAKKLLHSIFAGPFDGELFNGYEKFQIVFESIELYSIAFEKLEDDNLPRMQKRIEAVEGKLDHSYHHLEVFFRFFSFTGINPLTNYRLEMTFLKESWEKEARAKDILAWGDIVFTHFLFLTTLTDFENEAKVKLSEALYIYSKFNNYRANLIRKMQAAIRGSSFKGPRKVRKGPIYKEFNGHLLLESNKNIKHLVRCGINSAQRYKSEY